MNRIEHFTVYDGYTIEEHCTELGLEEGRALMATKAKRKVVSIQKVEDTVNIVKQFFLCSSCGDKISATSRFIGVAPYVSASISNVTASTEEIRNYLSDQYSLFSDEPLRINHTVLPKHIRCRHCEAMVEKANHSYPITITADQKNQIVILDIHKPHPDNVFFKTTITCKTSVKPLKFYTERIIFNCELGEVTWNFLDEVDTPVLTGDCTFDMRIWKELDSYRLIANHYLVKRKLTRAFQYALGSCPFKASNMTPLNAVLSTLFLGYPTSFYSSIPICGNTIEERFIPIAKKLHLAKKLPELFEASVLPQKRSVRKQFFTFPELFFFVKECETLALAFNNIDLFLNVLSSEACFAVLSDMFNYHLSPFLVDYARVRSSNDLAHLLIDCWDIVSSYAKDYGVCSPTTRRMKQKEWVNGIDAFRVPASFHIPHSLPEHSIVEGYEFIRLKSQRQLSAAANDLENCLKTYPQKGTIYGIRRNQHYVAALELVDRTVVMFLGIKNSTICFDTKLNRAFMRWVAMHGLQVQLDEDDEDE